jgi:hypothetical protein
VSRNPTIALLEIMMLILEEDPLLVVRVAMSEMLL